MKATYEELVQIINEYWWDFFLLKKTDWFVDTWLKDNMHVYHAFEEHAKMLKPIRNFYSARTIVHKLRWDHWIREDNSKFKVSDHCSAYLARVVMRRNPELEGMFQLNNVMEEI